MKRSLGAIVCLLTVIGTMSAVSAGPIITDNFDSYTVGSTPVPPWSKTGTAIATISDAFSVSGDNSIHFSDTGSDQQVQLVQSFTPITHFVLEYDMLTSNSNYEGAFVALVGHPSQNADQGDEFHLGFSNGGYIGVHGGGVGWFEPELLPYEEDTWYHVRHELNLVTNTGSFYVEEVGNPANSASYSIGKNWYFNNTDVYELVLWSSMTAGADGYIDNVTLTPEPATLSLLALSGLAMIRQRRKR